MTDMTVAEIVNRQRDWSQKTFGPGDRTKGIVEHIRLELAEVLESGGHIEEWIDIIILALDGAWRCGHAPKAIASALIAKQDRNAARTWPPPGSIPSDQPAEHIRGSSD